MEKVLIRQSGGQVPSLADAPAFEANSSAMFRDVNGYFWLNVKPLIEGVKKQFPAPQPGAPADNPLGVRPEKIVEAIGLGGLKTVAFTSACQKRLARACSRCWLLTRKSRRRRHS
jgi:hypothetical protein